MVGKHVALWFKDGDDVKFRQTENNYVQHFLLYPQHMLRAEEQGIHVVGRLVRIDRKLGGKFNHKMDYGRWG